MLGAIIGDIVGSPYEFKNNINTVQFPLFSQNSHFTDDTVMTVAIAQAVMRGYGDVRLTAELAVKYMKTYGSIYPNAGYGNMFKEWLNSENTNAYGSYGNGAAMRVSPVAWAYDNLDDVLEYATVLSKLTHDHPEAVKGAAAIAGVIFLARTGVKRGEIRRFVSEEMGMDISHSCDELRGKVDSSAAVLTVPTAIVAFLESKDFESAVRNAVSIGGDSDTIASMSGAIAEAFYDVPSDIKQSTYSYLDKNILDVCREWQKFIADKS